MGVAGGPPICLNWLGVGNAVTPGEPGSPPRGAAQNFWVSGDQVTNIASAGDVNVFASTLTCIYKINNTQLLAR